MSSTMGKAAIVVSGGILLSRVLGFLRDAVLAALLGRTIEADLYQAAFAIPDYLFFLMAGGYLAITFVPIVSRHLARSQPEEANRSFTAVTRVVGGLMLLATAATMVFARPLTELLYSGIDDEHIPELVRLVRIVLPAQFFFVLGSLLMAVQYAHQRFVIPTLAPLVYNVGIITGGLMSWAMGNPSPAGFVLGALAGAVVGNFLLQWWGARRVGLRWVKSTPLRHRAVPEYFALALPLMIGQSAVGLDEVFFRFFGQFGAEGDISALNYARRINMVPIGVIAQAAGVASYPFLARLFAEGNLVEMRATVSRALRMGLTVAGLGAAGVIGLALPVVRIAYQRGSFDPADTAATALLLAIYGVSVPMWVAHQVYTRGFYAQRRMWLPVVIGTVITLVAIPSYYYAVNHLGAPGVAGASVGVMTAYAATMAWFWHREAPAAEVGATAVRTLVAAVPSGLAAWAVSGWLIGGAVPDLVTSIAALLLGGSAAVGTYWVILRLVGAPELTMFRRTEP